jgi:hypothetical protein
MPTIKILVRKIDEGTGFEVPGPIQMGKRFIFTEDLVLEEYDDSTPGNGLPQNESERLAATHSGVVTLVRVAEAGDLFFPVPSLLFQYEATYKFNDLANTPLRKGQVTGHGLFLIDNVNDFNPLEQPIRFAITGGTDVYVTARGQITEGQPNPQNRRLDIQV